MKPLLLLMLLVALTKAEFDTCDAGGDDCPDTGIKKPGGGGGGGGDGGGGGGGWRTTGTKQRVTTVTGECSFADSRGRMMRIQYIAHPDGTKEPMEWEGFTGDVDSALEACLEADKINREGVDDQQAQIQRQHAEIHAEAVRKHQQQQAQLNAPVDGSPRITRTITS